MEFFDTSGENSVDYRRPFTSINALNGETEHSGGFFYGLRGGRCECLMHSKNMIRGKSRDFVRMNTNEK